MLWGTKWETAKVALLLCNDVVFLSSANPVCTGIKNECMEKHFRKRIMLWGTRWEETAASLTLLAVTEFVRYSQANAQRHTRTYPTRHTRTNVW